MENLKNVEFKEMSTEELQQIDGGLLGITLTLGAKIAIGCFAGGTVLGLGWALCGHDQH